MAVTCSAWGRADKVVVSRSGNAVRGDVAFVMESGLPALTKSFSQAIFELVSKPFSSDTGGASARIVQQSPFPITPDHAGRATPRAA